MKNLVKKRFDITPINQSLTIPATIQVTVPIIDPATISQEEQLFQLNQQLDSKLQEYNLWDQDLTKREKELEENEAEIAKQEKLMESVFAENDFKEQNTITQTNKQLQDLQSILFNYKRSPEHDFQEGSPTFHKLAECLESMEEKIKTRINSVVKIHSLYHHMTEVAKETRTTIFTD